MGRIVSIIQFIGRAGSAVGSKGKGGKVLLRQYQPSVTNPRTPAQVDGLEVMEPLWLRKEIAAKVKRMWNHYKS